METANLKNFYKVTPTERDGKHFYKVESEDGTESFGEYGSVTNRLDLIGGSKTNALMGWAVKTSLSFVEDKLRAILATGGAITDEAIADILKAGRKRPEKVKDEAADLGTRVHALIDLWIDGKTLPELKEDEKVAFGNFLHFVEKRGLSFICGDMPVASVKYGYGGRLDALAFAKNGKVVLFDWKTSNAIRDDYALQVAGYAVALEETHGLKPDRAIVVRFDKVDPNVLDSKEIHLTRAIKTWKSLVKFHKNYYKGAWKNGK